MAGSTDKTSSSVPWIKIDRICGKFAKTRPSIEKDSSHERTCKCLPSIFYCETAHHVFSSYDHVHLLQKIYKVTFSCRYNILQNILIMLMYYVASSKTSEWDLLLTHLVTFVLLSKFSVCPKLFDFCHIKQSEEGCWPQTCQELSLWLFTLHHKKLWTFCLTCDLTRKFVKPATKAQENFKDGADVRTICPHLVGEIQGFVLIDSLYTLKIYSGQEQIGTKLVFYLWSEKHAELHRTELIKQKVDKKYNSNLGFEFEKKISEAKRYGWNLNFKQICIDNNKLVDLIWWSSTCTCHKTENNFNNILASVKSF